MTAWKKKLGVGLGALALMVGAVPVTVSTASAWETGQLLDKSCPGGGRRPCGFVAKAAIVVGLAALIYLIVKVSDKGDAPTSP